MTEEVREARVRRVLARRGYQLKKARRFDRKALDYGKFAILDLRGKVVAGVSKDGFFAMTLDDVEKWMEG